MRLLHAVVFFAIALPSATASSDEPLVALAIEPDVSAAAPALTTTLESAARANDFATFDALYRANPDPTFRTLHELWSYAMTDRVGAFYGNEQYEQLAREYPGYAESIAPYKIVDSHGAVFYPVSETRAFLLEQRGVGALPVVRVARARSATKAETKAGTKAGTVQRRVAKRAPAAVTTTPAAPAPAPTPAEDLALLTTTVSTAAPAPVVTPAPAAATQSTVTETAAPAPAKQTNRGLLLVIIGLVGVGLLALIVRAPREVIP